MNFEQHAQLEAAESRVKTLLPGKYQDRYEEVQPVSMGSAGLKYGADGAVAWDDMWDSFCDLAMAGGPPHKGTLLEPGSQAEIDARPDQYESVVQEICRGIKLVADLYAEPSCTPGWVRMNCVNRVTADWLHRAITMENVSVRSEGCEVELPAGPSYRLEKEIKNVITAVAKTTHYWFGHILREQRAEIRELLTELERESPLLQPARTPSDSCKALKQKMSAMISQTTGLETSNHDYCGWLGFRYPSVRAAIWVMRALVASNVLSRREGTTLFVPVDPVGDPDGEKAVAWVTRLNGLAGARGIL